MDPFFDKMLEVAQFWELRRSFFAPKKEGAGEK
jgi:hypothetical protein